MDPRARKVCIYSPSEGVSGGGQISIDQLCGYLLRHGLDASILTPEPCAFTSPTLRMPSAASPWHRLQASFGVARRLREQRVDTIVLNDLSSLWLAPVFRLFRFKVVAFLHRRLQRRDRSGIGHDLPRYHLLRLASRFCDAVVSVSRENCARFPARVDFVGNCVPDWFFSGEPPAEKPFDLVLAARFEPEKDVPLALELLHRLNARGGAPLRMLLVGRGAARGAILARIAALGLGAHVEVRDWVPREALPGLFDLGRCFVISSRTEGFATTLLEAHARGLPALVTRGSGTCAEFVEGFGGRSGLVFAPEDLLADAFLDAALALVRDAARHRERCIEKARRFNCDEVLGAIKTRIEEC